MKTIKLNFASLLKFFCFFIFLAQTQIALAQNTNPCLPDWEGPSPGTLWVPETSFELLSPVSGQSYPVEDIKLEWSLPQELVNAQNSGDILVDVNIYENGILNTAFSIPSLDYVSVLKDTPGDPFVPNPRFLPSSIFQSNVPVCIEARIASKSNDVYYYTEWTSTTFQIESCEATGSCSPCKAGWDPSMETGTWNTSFSIDSPVDGSVITDDTVPVRWTRPSETEIKTINLNVYEGGVRNEALSINGKYVNGTLSSDAIDASLFAEDVPICIDARISNGSEFTPWQVTTFTVDLPEPPEFSPCQGNYIVGASPPAWETTFTMSSGASQIEDEVIYLAYEKPANEEMITFDFLIWVDGELHDIFSLINYPYFATIFDGPLSKIPASAFPVGSSVCIEARVSNGTQANPNYSEWAFVDNLVIQPSDADACVSSSIHAATTEAGILMPHVDACESISGQFYLKDSSRQINAAEHLEHHPSGNMPADQFIWTANSSPLGIGSIVFSENYPARVPDVSEPSPLIDAHLNAANTYDYLYNILEINSIDGLGQELRSTVNVNVFPMGTADLFCYGLASFDLYSESLVYCQRTESYAQALDVVGHGWAHGLLLKYGSNLKLEFESGAIAESFADWFGLALEAYKGNPNHTLGETITTQRSFSEPSQYQQPEVYGKNFSYFQDVLNGNCELQSSSSFGIGNENCFIHTNSGIGNKFFYLLTHGGNFRGYTNTGINVDDAMKIAVGTMVSLPQTATFEDARIVMEDWVSVNMPEYSAQTKMAWDSVGVGSQHYHINVTILSNGLPNSSGGVVSTVLEPIYPGEGNGLVESFVTATPSNPFIAGDLIELQASVNSGYAFEGFDIDGDGEPDITDLNYVIPRLNTPAQAETVPEPIDINITAIFSLPVVSVTTSLAPNSVELNGVASFSGAGDYPLFELATISVDTTAIPSSYSFLGWSGLDNVLVIGSPREEMVSFLIVSNEDVNAFANFSVPLALHVNNENWGSASILTAPPYEFGTSLNIRATPDVPPGPSAFSTYWKFVMWEDQSSPGVNLNLNANDFYTPIAPTTLVAVFEPKQYSLRVNSGIGKFPDFPTATSISLVANYDESQSFRVVAPLGWEFDKWSGSLNSSANPVTITVEDVAADVGGLVEITANYKRKILTGCDHPTLTTVQVDEVPYAPSGCSASQLDDDGDGIYLNKDLCPGTPENAIVNSQGCAAGQIAMSLPKFDIAQIEFQISGSGTFYPYEYMSPVVMDNGDLLQAFWYGNAKDEIRVYKIPPLLAGQTIIINELDYLFRLKARKATIFGIPFGSYNIKFEGMDNKYVYISPSFWTGVVRCKFWDEGDLENSEDDNYFADRTCDHNVNYSVKQPNYWMDNEQGDSWLFSHWILAPEIGSITHDFEKRITYISARNTGTLEFHNVFVDLNTPEGFVRTNTQFQAGVYPGTLNYWNYGFAGNTANPLVFGWDNMAPGAAASSIDTSAGIAYDANFDMNLPLLQQKDPYAQGFYAMAANEEWVIGWTRHPGVIIVPFIEELAACRLSSSGFPVQNLTCSEWKIIPQNPSSITSLDNLTIRLLLGDKSKIYAGPYEDYNNNPSTLREQTALYVLDLEYENFENAQWIPVGALTPDIGSDPSGIEETSEMISGVVADNGMLLVADRFEINPLVPLAQVISSNQAKVYKLLMPIKKPVVIWSLPENGIGDIEGLIGSADEDHILGTVVDDNIHVQNFDVNNSIEVIDGGEGVNTIIGVFNSFLDFSHTLLINIDSINGSNGNDTIIGSNGEDTVNGNNGQDVLNGGEGDDIIDGGKGNDLLTGGVGDDLLIGGQGDDTYFYNAGDGFDVIDASHGGADAVILNDIVFADVVFYISGNDLVIDLLSGSGQIIITDWVTGIAITVQDSQGVVLNPAQINADLNSPPEIISLPTTLGFVNEEYQYAIQAVDPDNDTLTYDLISEPEAVGMSVIDNQIVWTPNISQFGEYEVSVLVSDGYFTVEQNFTLTIEFVEFPSLIITSQPVINGLEGQEYQYPIEVTNLSGGILSYYLIESPFGMRVEQNVIVWDQQYVKKGRHYVALKVANETESTEQYFVLTIDGVNQPPKITSLPTTTVRSEETFEYSIIATDPEGVELSYELVVWPSGMILANNQLIWLPGSASGKHTVKVSVSDGVNTVQHNFTLTVVDAAADSLIITSNPVVYLERGQIYEYKVMVDDPDGDPSDLTYSVVHPNLYFVKNVLTGKDFSKGTKTVTVPITVTGGGKSVTQTVSFEIGTAVATHPDPATLPVITSVPLINRGLTNTTYFYDVIAHGADGGAVSYSIEAVNPSSCTSSCAYILGNRVYFRPTQYSNPYLEFTITIGVTDLQLGTKVTQDWVMLVSSLSVKPFISTSPPLTGVIGELYQYFEDASPAGLRLTTTFGLAPVGMSMSRVDSTSNANNISWTPAPQHRGTNSVEIIVGNGIHEADNAVQRFVINVSDRENREPEYHGGSPSLFETRINRLYHYTIFVDDPDSDDITFNLVEWPKTRGLTISGNVISWMPEEADEGDHQITVFVSDGRSVYVKEFIWRVNPDYRGDLEPPLADAGSDVTMNYGESISLSASNSSDTDGTIVSWQWSKEGVVLGTEVDFALSSLLVGSHAITLTVTDSDGLTDTDTVNVLVNSETLPTVSLTSPVNGASLYALSSITLSALATDPAEAIAKVEFFAGQTLIGIDTVAPYQVQWSDVSVGTYSLTAKATSVIGASAISAPVNVSVVTNPLVLNILTPADGLTLSDNFIIVTGTFTAPFNSGITVNGDTAVLSKEAQPEPEEGQPQRQFFAQIPLEEGQNTITATLTSMDGNSISKSITVNFFSIVVAPKIIIESETLEGLAPLPVTVTVINQSNEDVLVQWNGGVNYPVAAGATLQLSVTFTEAGTYHTDITVRDTSGVVLIGRTFFFTAVDSNNLDGKLRDLWREMTEALIAGDKATALHYLSAGAQTRYSDVFDALLVDMPLIINDFSELHSSELTNDYGEYAINRTINGENRLFFIYFVKDANGIWRIESM